MIESNSFTKLPNYKDFSFDFVLIEGKKTFMRNYVAVQQNVNNNYSTIIGFSDSVSDLVDKIKNRYSFGKRNYQFFIYDIMSDTAQYYVDLALLHLCQSAANAMEIACTNSVNNNKRFIKCGSLEGIIKDSLIIFEHSLDVPFPFDLPAVAVIA